MRKPQVFLPLVWQYWPIFALAGIFSSFYPLPGTILALIILYLEKRLHNWLRVSLAALIFFGAALLAAQGLNVPPPDSPSWTPRSPGKKAARFCALVESSRGLTDGRLQIILSGLHIQNGDETLPGNAIWTWDAGKSGLRPLPGQEICLTRAILPIHDYRNENISLREIRSRSQNILWRVWSHGDVGEMRLSGAPTFFAGLRWDLEKKLIEHSGLAAGANAARNPSLALIPALLFGDRFFISQAIADKFAKAAIGHSLALSGQHLAIAALFSYLAILTLGRFCPQIYLWRPKLILMGLGACPFALIYLWLGAAPPSLMRAACMLFIFCAIFSLYKNFSGLDVLLLALCVLLFINPYGVLDTGLQLSFLCVLVLTGIAPALFHNNHLKPPIARFLGYLVNIFFISLVLQTALLPLTLKIFGTSGMWFPINVFWLPLLGLVVLPFSFIALLFLAFPFDCAHTLGGYCLQIASLPVSWLLHILDWLHSNKFLYEPVFVRPHWSALFAYGLIFTGFACVAKLGKQNFPMRNSVLSVAFSPHSFFSRLFSKNPFTRSASLAYLSNKNIQFYSISPLTPFPRLPVFDGTGKRDKAPQPRSGFIRDWPLHQGLPEFFIHFQWKNALKWLNPDSKSETTAAKFLCLGLVFLAIGPFLRLERYFAYDPVLEVFDVGQGQAILLDLGRSGKILVDGGGTYSKRFDTGKDILTPILTDNHAPELAAIINSHPDLDHLGGLLHPIENFNFQKLFHNGRAAVGTMFEKWEKLKNQPNSYVLGAGDIIRIQASHFYLEALSPPADTYFLSSNNASLALRLTDGKRGLVLIPGDAEKESLKKLLDEGIDISAQILIAPHHGSNSSFSARFLEKVNPGLVIAACGFRNRYFYPGKKLREWTRKKGVELLDTGESGRIRIILGKEGNLKVEKVFRD